MYALTITDTNTDTVVRTHFDARIGLWVASTGEPICQDHIEPLPCPYRHRGKPPTDH